MQIQALSFPSFATAQGVGECLKVCLYEGMDVKMNGCVWMKVVLKMGMNDQAKTHYMAATHTSFYRGSAWQWEHGVV